jgi:enamine deaminase RidA (YjgF/YER057c/UK114 family)
MARQLISTGSKFEEMAGYSRAVVDGEWIFVSGCTGYDYAADTIADDVTEQTHQTFRNVEDALGRAGAALVDVVRARIIISEQRYFADVWPILGEYFRDIRPANTTWIAALADPRMKVEIEVTALKRDA